jgi:acyl-[acyl carrier protein]--UDP-N-acetylglucosamine O-acyltransferase
VTGIGSHNLLRPYLHIAHDCRLGSHIIITNGGATQALEAIEARGL